jgi:TPR repeat protein
MSNWPGAARRLLVSAGLLLLLSASASAYDFKKMEAAIESLSPATQGEWERKALEGDPLAQNVTGMAYKYGIGVPQDHGASILWFHIAAEQGEADAQFNLARIYDSRAEGPYKKKRAALADDAEASKWYRLSAEQGHTQAQVKLAQLYAKGRASVPPDPMQAYKWLTIAAARGDATAAKLRANLAAGLTRKQIAEGDAQAMTWTRMPGAR